MIKKPKAWMMVGLPYTGKSSWINHHSNNGNEPFMVIDTDSALEHMARNANKTYEETFHQNFREAERQMYQRLELAKASDIHIFWDQTNLTSKSRKKKLAMIPSTYEKIAVVFPELTAEEYEKRMAARLTKIISYKVIESLKKSYEPPSLDEGFDFIIDNSHDMHYM